MAISKAMHITAQYVNIMVKTRKAVHRHNFWEWIYAFATLYHEVTNEHQQQLATTTEDV